MFKLLMQPVSLKSNYCGRSHWENVLSLSADALKNISSHSLMCSGSQCGAVSPSAYLGL